jgi:hypothetical protein
MADSEVKESTPSSSFADKALSSIPRPVMGLFGVLFGLVLFLIFGGFQSSLNRIVNAYASRIERSVDSLELVVSKINTTTLRVDAVEKRVDSIDVRLRAVEIENDRIHQNLRGKRWKTKK